MKKILKGIFIPMGLSMIFGFVCAKLVYKVYGDSIETTLKSSKLYLVESGKYLTYDNMREENSTNNYIYYRDDDGYKTVVGITKDENNIDKIKSLYSDNVNIEEYYISSELLNNKQNEYDIMLNNSEDYDDVKEIVDNILNLYRAEDGIKLILVE